MKCRYCSSDCIKKGVRNHKQRYQCKVCGKYQLENYSYRLYDEKDDRLILAYNAESTSISSMSRLLGYSKQTIIRRIIFLASRVARPLISEFGQTYEVDEMWTFIGKNRPENYAWITYAMSRKTKRIIDVVVGSRTSDNLRKVINKIKILHPKKIITDRLNVYPNLVFPEEHDTERYQNNKIERNNLTLRQDIKRLNRKTLSFSKSLKMLESTILLYFFWHNWQM